MTHLLRRVVDMASAGSMLVVVLIASMMVGGLLAYQAVTAARQRSAISEGMLRQYAQLALGELSRQARRDIDSSLMHALGTYAHANLPAHRQGTCDCGSLERVDQYFEVWPSGDLRVRNGTIDARFRDAIAKAAAGAPREGGEGALKLAAMPGDRTRFIASKWEPHVGASGGDVGLVAATSALAPVVARSYRRANLLPSALVGQRDVRALVDVHLTDETGATVFASERTQPGPHVIDAAFLPELPLGLAAQVSMTPAFIATLGPEHGAGPSIAVIVALVALNALLVAAGLWQLAKERELARLRANFIAGVSHELRTPLAQIRMFSETLLLERVRNVTERRRALEIIGQESQRLSQLVDNVLHFHRPKPSTVATEGAPIDLDAFVREVVESFQPIAASRRARIVVSSDVRDVAVHGDASTLRQVLLNLLDNAVKFGPTDQTVAIALRQAGDVAVLSVADQGPGVPLADRHRIFSPFERGRQTNGTGGAGIGLAVVQQIVAAHGGQVTVDDGPGGGARFTVSLPLAGARSPAPMTRIAG